MAEHNIKCIDCGGPYVAARSDAKRCAPCRLLSILTYTASRCGPRTCRGCGDTYRPFRRGDRLCGTCEPIRTKKPPPTVTCSICKRDAFMYQRVTVCACCAKGKEAQPVVIRALQKGLAARRQANRDNDQPKP